MMALPRARTSWKPRFVVIASIAACAAAVAVGREAPSSTMQAIPPEVIEEWKLQAHEEVARLEALVKMRKSEARAADAELETSQVRQNYTENMATKGLTSKAILKANQNARLDSEMRVAIREALLKEAEIHLAQAKRRMARLDRGPVNLLLDAGDSSARMQIRMQELEASIADLLQRGESMDRRLSSLEQLVKK
ncbi:hypothetical protein EP7_001677 [Isosphaeraceae bacterium EP7]